MSTQHVTDYEIQRLLSLGKDVLNPSTRARLVRGHVQQNFRLQSQCGQNFKLYIRQNKTRWNDFSCGIVWYMPDGDSLTLVRYNGSSHSHPNRLEDTETGYVCHIHKATERYIKAAEDERCSADGYAESTDRYSMLEQAVDTCVSDNNIIGINVDFSRRSLFYVS